MIGKRSMKPYSICTIWTMPSVSSCGMASFVRDGNGGAGGFNRQRPPTLIRTLLPMRIRSWWRWMPGSGWRSGARLRGEIFGFPVHAPLRVVRFVLEDGLGPSTRKVIQPQDDLRAVLDRIGERLNFQIATSLVGQRALRGVRTQRSGHYKARCPSALDGRVGAGRCRCCRRGEFYRNCRVKLPHDVPVAGGRQFIELAREIATAIMRTTESGWALALTSTTVNPDDGEVELTERLRDAMRLAVGFGTAGWNSKLARASRNRVQIWPGRFEA